jgi:hypothetical protein
MGERYSKLWLVPAALAAPLAAVVAAFIRRPSVGWPVAAPSMPLVPVESSARAVDPVSMLLVRARFLAPLSMPVIEMTPWAISLYASSLGWTASSPHSSSLFLPRDAVESERLLYMHQRDAYRTLHYCITLTNLRACSSDIMQIRATPFHIKSPPK